MNPTKKTEFKKVSGQVFDPSRDAKANNVFDNINISDDVAHAEEKALNQVIHKSRIISADHRSDKEIKASLREI